MRSVPCSGNVALQPGSAEVHRGAAGCRHYVLHCDWQVLQCKFTWSLQSRNKSVPPCVSVNCIDVAWAVSAMLAVLL